MNATISFSASSLVIDGEQPDKRGSVIVIIAAMIVTTTLPFSLIVFTTTSAPNGARDKRTARGGAGCTSRLAQEKMGDTSRPAVEQVRSRTTTGNSSD